MYTTPGFSHLTPDLGVVPVGSGLPPLRPFVEAVLPLAFTLCGGALAFVRAQLSVVSRSLAFIGDLLPLIGGSISSVGNPMTPRELVFPQPESHLADVQLGGAAIEFASGGGALLTGHESI